jgi:phage portal protein BeeE
MFERLRNLLSPPEHKSSRTARLIALESGGRARWTPRDYAALAREGYTKNAIVHRAVRLIAESIGGLSFVLYEGAAELSAHPLLDLLARPNPRQDGASLLETIAAHLLLAGNAYVEAVALQGDLAGEGALRRCASCTRCGPTA